MTLINQHRASMGEGQLVTSPTLSASAVWKARHMAAYNYFGHDDPAPPVARTAADRVATCGYSASWGENIAEGFTTATAVVNAWLGSAGHRANIENASFVATGIGVATSSSGVVYWVQDFGFVADGSPPPPATTTPSPTTTTTPPPPPTTTSTTAGTTTTRPTTTTAAAPPSAGHRGTNVSSLTLKVVRVRVRGGRLVVAARVSGAAAPSAAAVKCKARVGRADLRVVVSAYRGVLARCAWRLPKAVRKGAVVRGWIRVRDGGLHVRRTFRLPLS